MTDTFEDKAARDGIRGWLIVWLGLLLACSASAVAPTKISFISLAQSSDASITNTAAKAVDGSTVTYSLTADAAGSYWVGQLSRPYTLDRIEISNRAAPFDILLGGLTLRVWNMDGQVMFQTVITNPGPGALSVISFPPGTIGRSIWIGLPGNQTNNAGSRRVSLAEVNLFGLPTIPYSPDPVSVQTNGVQVWQSSEYGGYPASFANDGNTGNFTHTANQPNSYWMTDLGAAVPLNRIEVVNRSSCCDKRLGGLVLRIYDAASNSIASAILSNPGLGGTWTNFPSGGTTGRWVRIGLENGQTNNDGNYYVSLAEVRIYSGTTNMLRPSSSPVPLQTNLASAKRCYMVRFSQSIPSATNANDDVYLTETKTTMQTVDGYWETDLGATYALYGVRTIGASDIGSRMTNTICRLYDEAHESVFAKKLTGYPDVFDTDLDGPVFARYVRIGLEDKQRTDPAGGLEWYIGMREVEVFGRPTNSIGVQSFTTSTNQVLFGQAVTLSWALDDIWHAEIRPSIGSVGSYTATNGVGSFLVTITNSTEFTLIATNPGGIFSRSVSVQVGPASLPLRLSEVVAENKYSLKDGYGDASDWIEVRNPGDLPVNLAGYGLSDDPALPMKWTFPPTNIAPHSFLIVFASGKSTPLDPAGNLHANFRLEKNGGAVQLTASNGITVLDSLTYPALDTDLAYGRDLEGTWSFMEPTPGAINTGTKYAGWLDSLTFSHSRGFYDTPFTLTIGNSNAGATVLYSLDGTVPSLPYNLGISISGTRSLRARASRAGYKPARIQTRTFVFVNDVITSPLMNTAITQDPAYAPRMRPGLLSIPSISLVVPSTPTYDEQEGSMEILWPNNTGHVQENCGIYRYGGSWQQFAKASFTVSFRSIYGSSKLQAPLFEGFEHGVLARTSFDKLEFNGGNQDMNARGFYMADRFVQDSMLDMGSLNPHGRFVHVYLNGSYWGQYNCKEVLMEHFLADYLGGDTEDYVSVKGNDNVGDNFVLGTPDAPITQPWERVVSLRNSYVDVRPYLDVPHLVDFMLLWNYGDAESEYRACGTRNAGSGFKFWMNDSDGFLRTSAMGLNRVVRNGPGDLFSGLVGESHVDFKILLADRVYAHFFNQGALTPAANDKRLADRMREIHDSLLAECARWNYRTPANWESSAASIRLNLFPARTSELVGFLRSGGLYPTFDPPTFNQFGGLVTNGFHPGLTVPSGTIYYTLDGSDPRLAGGGVSAQALIWTNGVLAITNDITLNVRVRLGSGAWSALAQPRFLLATRRTPNARDLLITEINYNPTGSDEYEFVEIWNASTNLLDLTGVSLSNAVRYIFPPGYALAPGNFLLVVENTAAFAARYQNASSPWYWPTLAVAGEWTGALDNSGETLSLFASNGVELSSVPYQTGGDWPERADGKGSSLELATLPSASATDQEVRALVADGRNWNPSSLYNGSPGRFDSFTRSVYINELLSHSELGEDWLELFNAGSQPVNLPGCTVTDDLAQPARWAFPSNTVLQPGQFMVLQASQLGFAFSEFGESAGLLQMAGTNIIRFLDMVDFPAANREESFGLFQRSDGVLDFTELRANTPAAANALPRVGPVVFSEIMFAPPPGKAQFVELANLNNIPVPLFDPAHPTNVWMMHGLGNFAFPAGTILPACSTLIVCSTNPAAFRAQYAVNPAVPVFGPWPGVLDNDGETLKLLQPGDPQPDGSVPYYRVDHVSFRTTTPWPPATNGASLEKVALEAYGNDPAYWRTGSTNGSPGVPASNRPPVIHVDGPLTVPALTPVTLTVSAVDLDAPWQTVTLATVQLPPGSSFDPVSGTFHWTPSETQAPGNYLATFSAHDSAGCGSIQTTQSVFLTVTDPFKLSATIASGALQLTFAALVGESYRVEYTDTLSPPTWHVLQDIPSVASTLVTVADPGTTGRTQRYYRLLWIR